MTMMQQRELTDAEVKAKIVRIDRFRDALRDAISATMTDRESNCAEPARRGLRRIAETLDLVPDVTLHNLAVIDDATAGVVMAAVEVRLLAVGGGPTLDYADATAFLAMFEPMIDMALKRRFN